MSIVEQVREGLEEKISGINNALTFIRDPREIERLSKDLKGAMVALDKLNKPDSRSDEERKKLAEMISGEVEIEASNKGWSTLSPFEKFKYQIDLYCNKVNEALTNAKAQHDILSKVVKNLSKTDFKIHPYMQSIYTQFVGSLRELEFSIEALENQLSMKEAAIKIIDEDFESLVTVNMFLNNPMSLPHLAEEREAKLSEVRNDKKK